MEGANSKYALHPRHVVLSITKQVIIVMNKTDSIISYHIGQTNSKVVARDFLSFADVFSYLVSYGSINFFGNSINGTG